MCWVIPPASPGHACSADGRAARSCHGQWPITVTTGARSCAVLVLGVILEERVGIIELRGDGLNAPFPRR